MLGPIEKVQVAPMVIIVDANLFGHKAKDTDGKSEMDELTRRLEALSLQVERQEHQIQALQEGNRRLTKLAVSKHMITEFRQHLYSLSNTELLYLSQDPEIQGIINDIDLTNLQSENDPLVLKLINRMKTKQAEYQKPCSLSQWASALVPCAVATTFSYYAPAVAGYTMQAVFENSYDQYLPEAFMSTLESSGKFGQFIGKDAHSLKAIQWAMNTADEKDPYFFAAGYFFGSKVLVGGCQLTYQCTESAVSTMRLAWQGKSKTNLHQFLDKMEKAETTPKAPLRFSPQPLQLVKPIARTSNASPESAPDEEQSKALVLYNQK